MDRNIVYVSQIPQDTDILQTNLHPYISIAKLAAAILGTSTQLNGLGCTATSPASMTVQIAPGEIYQIAQIDTSAYGSLPINTNQILKQGIMLTTYTSPTFTAPSTVGYSQNFLIEFALSETDGGSQVLPYYNSANPSQAYEGPNNDGQPNYTIRQDRVGIQIKAGTAAPTGTQTTPSVDAGYVGAWVITIAHAQTTITSSNIALYSGAPFIPATIANFITQAQLQSNQYLYGADTSGTANSVNVTLSPAITAYATGQVFWVKIANTNTGASTINFNTVGAAGIKLKNGVAISSGDMVSGSISVFSYNGTNFELLNPGGFDLSTIQLAIQNSSYTYAADTGTANAYAAALTPAITAYTTGLNVTVKITNTNTSTTNTLALNGLAAKSIKLTNGSNPNVGDLVSGMIAYLEYDGTEFQLINPATLANKNQIQNSSYTYAADTGTANNYAIALSPAISSYVTGLTVVAKISNANTGASTLSVNGLSAINIKNPLGAPLQPGDLQNAQMAVFYYDGTNFQLLNSATLIKRINVQTFTTSGTYNPSAGIIQAIVKAVSGGGGSGGIISTGLAGGSGGGGSGAYLEVLLTAAQIGSNQAVTIGSAGIAGTTSAAGGNGGTTSLGSLFSCTGGSGSALVTGSASVQAPTVGGAGGTATVSTGTTIVNIPGQSGSNGLCNGTVTYSAGGVGGSNPLGFGGVNLGGSGSVVGNTGTGYGSGGGGSAITSSNGIGGAAGKAGYIEIIEYLAE